MLTGIGVSSGISIGKVLIKEEQKMDIQKTSNVDVNVELKKFTNALNKAKEQINHLYKVTLESIGEEEAKIFEAHGMILEDPELLNKVKSKIEKEQVNVEWALKEVSDSFIMIFESMNDEYMKERASDIKDVTNRVMRIVQGIELNDFSNLDEKVIIVAKDLTPSDTAAMDKKNVIGFVTEIGGRTSHSAIMARTLGIPAVVGVNGLLSQINNGDNLVFNGNEGSIYINPEKDIIQKFEKEKERLINFKKKLKKLIGNKSISKDGIQVELAANIGTPKDLDSVLENDAEAIGLFRSEFLYMNRNNFPVEEEQFNAYKEVAKRMKGKNVIIRTLDIGGDKKLPYFSFPEEMNPFLGYRAIRLCLDQVDIFKTQLRALLRASAYGNIKILIPMISSITELRQAKSILEEVKNELRKENISFDENIKVGIMIETPAAAIISDLLAKEVDFFSIGTNDLIQYTVAVDRMNQKISYLYNPFNPAILRLVKKIIDNGHKAGIWVGMCGEMAGDPSIIPILLGMGLDELSMSPTSVLNARYIIRNTSQKYMEAIIEKILMLPTAEEIEKYII